MCLCKFNEGTFGLFTNKQFLFNQHYYILSLSCNVRYCQKKTWNYTIDKFIELCLVEF